MLPAPNPGFFLHPYPIFFFLFSCFPPPNFVYPTPSQRTHARFPLGSQSTRSSLPAACCQTFRLKPEQSEAQGTRLPKRNTCGKKCKLFKRAIIFFKTGAAQRCTCAPTAGHVAESLSRGPLGIFSGRGGDSADTGTLQHDWLRLINVSATVARETWFRYQIFWSEWALGLWGPFFCWRLISSAVGGHSIAPKTTSANAASASP